MMPTVVFTIKPFPASLPYFTNDLTSDHNHDPEPDTDHARDPEPDCE